MNLRLRRALVVGAAAVVGLVALAAPPSAAANNDIYLRGLVEDDGNGNLVPRNADFKKLTTELGFVLTPSPLQPAETTGQAGFDFAIGYTVHQISSQEAYWRDSVAGKLDGREIFPVLSTIGVRGRKGFILPVPLTSEIELGAQWLIDSTLLNLGGKVRVALNEGFAYIPDVAVEAGINRLVGSQDIDFTTVTAGGSISKGVGIAGDFNLAPFVSYQSIWINAASRIIDLDPTNTGDVGNNITFDRIEMVSFDGNGSITGMNRYDRVSAGIRANVNIVAFHLGLDVNLIPENGTVRPMFQYSGRAGILF